MKKHLDIILTTVIIAVVAFFIVNKNSQSDQDNLILIPVGGAPAFDSLGLSMTLASRIAVSLSFSSDDLDFVEIPSGSYMMGSPQGTQQGADELPSHAVSVGSFQIMATEVTIGTFNAVMNTDVDILIANINFDQSIDSVNHLPAHRITVDDCNEFLRIINSMNLDYIYRLPTEAEWEYACRAGTDGLYYWSDNLVQQDPKAYCWFNQNSDMRVHPVGSLSPNDWGLYDMSGNVWEWCQDTKHVNYLYAPTDGSAWVTGGSGQIARGGSCQSELSFCRSANRGLDATPNENMGGNLPPYIGFRLVREERVSQGDTLLSSGALGSFVENVSIDAQASLIDNQYANTNLVDSEFGEFALIPSGSYPMGSYPTSFGRELDELPQHFVEIEGFEMLTTEVTQNLWTSVMGTDLEDMRLENYEIGPFLFKADSLPMYCILWNDCQEFVDELCKLDSTYTYRLPTEAEWEYACRAGSNSVFYWGDETENSVVSDFCWYALNTDSSVWLDPHSSIEGVQPVGLLLPNAWGLFDMSGNVWEWCQDTKHNDYTNAPSEGSGWINGGSGRIARGGSWLSHITGCRSANRGYDYVPQRYPYIGFRVVRTANN